MDKYIYLIISIFLSFVWAVIIFARKDLKRKIIESSIIGGVAGLLAEFWYFKDYWQPLSILGRRTVSIEDFLFGFFVAGIAVSVYDALFARKNIQQEKNRLLFFSCLFFLGVISLLVFNNFLGFNSIFVSSFTFLFFSIVVVIIRRDLLVPSILSGIFLTVIMIPIYAIIFNIISPEYWNKYWLLANTKFGITVLGNIPATEILWYFSYGCLAGVGYDFVYGNKKAAKV